MTQADLIVLLLKVFLISGFCSLITWVAVYSAMAPWWRDEIGRTLVAKTLLIALLFVPSALALFFHFSPQVSMAAGWVDVALIGLVTPVMAWRTLVWVRIYRNRRKDGGV